MAERLVANKWTREERERIRRDAQNPEAQDGRHTYRWSEYGIRVHAKSGKWEGFYSLRHCEQPGDRPTRLVLTGISFGNPDGELAISFGILCRIIDYITGDAPDDPRFNLSPRRKAELSAAEQKAAWLSR